MFLTKAITISGECKTWQVCEWTENTNNIETFRQCVYFTSATYDKYTTDHA